MNSEQIGKAFVFNNIRKKDTLYMNIIYILSLLLLCCFFIIYKIIKYGNIKNDKLMEIIISKKNCNNSNTCSQPSADNILRAKLPTCIENFCNIEKKNTRVKNISPKRKIIYRQRPQQIIYKKVPQQILYKKVPQQISYSRPRQIAYKQSPQVHV